MEHSLRAARAAVASDRFNVAAWQEILRLSVREAAPKRRQIFEEYLELFPTRGSVWKQYILFEMNNKEDTRVKDLFKRCLMTCPYMPLWELYIKFLEDAKKPREEMMAALKLAVDTMKFDLGCSELWRKYIDLVKSQPADARRPYEVSRLTMETRNLYHECIALPHRGVEKIWKEYIEWETNLNQAIATKYTKEKGSTHAAARAMMVKLDKLTRRLHKDFPSLPPEKRDMQATEQQRIWEQLLAYEKSNPLKLQHDHEVTERVHFIYRQYLLCFSRYPTVWYEAAMYLEDAARVAQSKGDTETAERWSKQAALLFQQGREACPADLILHFAHADLLESKSHIVEAKDIYKSLLKSSVVDTTLVYVQYLKFTRRTEGVKAAREVFKAARGDERAGHHVYTASAFMELSSGPAGSQISRKIFEKGMDKFGASPSYADAFLTFMSHMGDTNNTRALFERFLAKVPRREAGPIWDKYVLFESIHGDLAGVLRVEQRRADEREALRQEAEASANLGASQRDERHTMDHLMKRYRFRELEPCPKQHAFLFGQAVKVEKPSKAGAGETKKGKEEAPASDGFDAGFNPFSTPDPAKLQRYKPMPVRDPGMRLTRPPRIAALMRELPPPKSYDGPHVDIDTLLQTIRDKTLPPLPASDASGSTDGKRRGAAGTSGEAPSKRAKEGGAAGTGTGGAAAPPMDVFTARQLQRQRQQQHMQQHH